MNKEKLLVTTWGKKGGVDEVMKTFTNWLASKGISYDLICRAGYENDSEVVWLENQKHTIGRRFADIEDFSGAVDSDSYDYISLQSFNFDEDDMDVFQDRFDAPVINHVHGLVPHIWFMEGMGIDRGFFPKSVQQYRLEISKICEEQGKAFEEFIEEHTRDDIQKVVAGNSDGLIFMNQYTYDIAGIWYPDVDISSNSMFLPNCTDISRHDNDRIRTRAKIVRKWYDDNNIIIYTGRIHPSKGIFDLAKAYDKVAEQYPGTKLLLAGVLQLTYDDEDGSECYRKILECISEDKHKDVHHLGWIEDKGMLACYLAASDVFVLPSYHENFSTSVLEALAMGTPSVVGDVDGSHEVFVAPGYAWGCEPKDHEGLAETLDHILSNKDRVVPMARQIQAEVNRRFNHERVFGRTMDYYRTLRA